MKHFPLLSWLITALFPLFLSAQSTVFAPVGATWRYSGYTAHVEGDNHFIYEVTGDTLLDGWNARVIKVSTAGNGVYPPIDIFTRYVSTIGDQVYYRVNGEFVLLFDFAAQPGDTIYTKADDVSPGDYWCCGYTEVGKNYGYVIDSIDVITIDGTPLRVQYATNLPGDFWGVTGIYTPGPIVERIGSIGQHQWYGGGSLCITGGYFPKFRCYQDSSIFFKGNIGNQDCDYIVGTASPELTQLSIAPNPFSDHITVQLPLGTSALLTIRDVSGRVVLRREIGEGSSVISTSGLRAGMYVWEVEDGARVESGKLVKI